MGEESGTGAAVEAGGGVEGEVGAGVSAAGGGGDGGAGVSGVILESRRGGVAEEADFGASAGFAGVGFGASAGFAGFRDGGRLGSFVFASSDFSEFAAGCKKAGKLGPDGVGPVGGLSRAGEVGEAPLPEPAEMGAGDEVAGAGLICPFCEVDGDSMPPVGTIITGGRGFVTSSFFPSGVGALSFFTPGDKGGKEGVAFPPFGGGGEKVFGLVPADPSEEISHSPAPFTTGKVGFLSPNAGAPRLPDGVEL